MIHSMVKGSAVIALLAVTAACGDTEPLGPRLGQELPLAGASEIAFADGRLVLNWLEPLAEDMSVEQTVGRAGGRLQLDVPGLRMHIGRNALKQDVDITMTARQGKAVAFDFAPHGTQFRGWIEVGIDLRNVANGKQLIDRFSNCGRKGCTVKFGRVSEMEGAYVGESAEGDSAVAIEEFKVWLVDGRWLTFYPDHFSGYALAM
jgi:hypothetical protein